MTGTPHTPEDAAPRWLDRKENVDRLCYVLYGACALLFFADLFYHRKTHFDFESWLPTGFSGVYGLVSCVGLVLAAKGLRRILMRPEDYYD